MSEHDQALLFDGATTGTVCCLISIVDGSKKDGTFRNMPLPMQETLNQFLTDALKFINGHLARINASYN